MRARLLAILLAAATIPRHAGAEIIDSGNGFVEDTWANVGGSVTGMAWAPDGSGRLFITKKDGAVRIVSSSGSVEAANFATISPIFTQSECGLIGMAFDPDFATNRLVYFFVTVSDDEQQIIRYRAAGNTGVEKTTIISGLPTNGANHDGGGIGFGPDGKLYWAIGDLGSGVGVDGNLTSMAAKVGRAGRDGSVPNDNPFFDGNGPNADYIWARGFRNPFTFTFQDATGELWVNSVGTSYEQVFVVHEGDHAGYNDYENNQPPGFITPVIVYRTNGTDVRNLSMASRSNGVATFTTMGSHRFRLGGKITVAGATDPSFDGAGYVTDVPSANQFRFTQAGTDVASAPSVGTATTLDIGGAITGGTFLDTSGVPDDYRGNYFFGDFNSDRIERVTLDDTNVVTSVDHWAENLPNMIDVSVGPDGALYYVIIGGQIYRTVYTPVAQGLVVTPLNLRMAEGGQAVFDVRLAQQPASAVDVTVTRSGSADVSIESGAAFTFSTGNWNSPRTVRLAAARDADSSGDSATLTVSASGIASESVHVAVTDEGAITLVLSTTMVTFAEAGTGQFTVALSAAPSASVTVDVARTAGDADITVSGGATLTFGIDDWDVPKEVTLASAADIDLDDDTATIGITADSIPTRTVAVTVTDDEPEAPTITSTADLTAVVGAPYSYDVDADGFPAPTFSLSTMPAGMSIDDDTGVISWTPAATGSYPVTVVAANGISPDDTQMFTIEVSADQPPMCMLTSPTMNETVSGTGAEFFGDGTDDVGTVKAEFFVDNVLRSTDTNSSGHYHYQSAHNMFDTTVFADGTHQARMTITDTAGATCSAEVTITVANQPDAGIPDAAPPDAKLPDARVGPDAAPPLDAAPDAPLPADAQAADAPLADAPLADASPADAAAFDARPADAALFDARPADAALIDARPADAAAAVDAAVVVDARPPDGRFDAAVPQQTLSGGGCDCHVAGGLPPALPAGFGVLLVLGLVVVRRRRHGARQGR